MHSVETKRKELSDIEPIYEIIQDAIDGESAIKAKTSQYLPIPSSCKNSIYDPRYIAYQTRALYFNLTQPTRDALVGQIFLRPPIIEVPDLLQPVVDDMNGEGLNLEQLTRYAANHVLPFGRGGLLTDFPISDGEITRGEVLDGTKRPIIRFFEPWAIRNWRKEKIGTIYKLVMLVLDESYDTFDEQNEFAIVTEIRQRVYKLVDNTCQVEVYQDGEITERYQINDSSGIGLNEIPFDFIGSENNDADVDLPPFTNLATLNIAHYRNSADYEESVYLIGQPTLVLAGLTQDWVDENFTNGIEIGSRTAIPLPENGSASLLQAEANMLAYEAMTHKEEQMIAIGAKITNPSRSSVERKEAEIEIEAASQKSVLTTIKDNLQLAIKAALIRAAKFIGTELSDDSFKIELNSNFDLRTMNGDELRSVMEAYDGHKLAFTEMREALRRSGLAKLTDTEALAAIKADLPMKKNFMEEMTPEPTVTPVAGGTAKKKSPSPASKK